MSAFERTTIGLFLKRLLPAAAVALFITPSSSHAEQLLLLHKATGSNSVSEMALQPLKKTTDIGLNKSGDLVIRSGVVSLTMAYSLPDTFIEPQERIRIVQSQDCPAINGISLKVSFQY